MKKIKAIVVALIIFLCIVNGYNNFLNKRILQSKDQLYYLGSVRDNCLEAAKVALNNSEKNDSILVLGSSELSSFHADIMNYGNSDFNMYPVGRGYIQCLQHTLNLGAIQNVVNIEKVVLILSPQWFQGTEDMEAEIFASRFQKEIFYSFIKNKNISNSTKKTILENVKKYEVADLQELEKIRRYENAYINDINLIERFSLWITDSISNTRQKRNLVKLLKDSNSNAQEKIKFSETNFEKLLKEADELGKKECTNNTFEIQDDYYTTYIKEKFESLKNSGKGIEFLKDSEYNYFDFFLTVCEELKVKPLIVIVPVHGEWFDYEGITKEAREVYYNKIREISKKHNAEIADFSNCEYEEYFLKDIMHLGRKGWIKVDEAIYKFYYEK